MIMGPERLIKEAGIMQIPDDEKSASLIINKDQIISKRTVPGLVVKTEIIKDGIKINITLKDNTIIDRPVHLCFGVTHKKAVQIIRLNLKIGQNSSMSVYSHCVFPFAEDVTHEMDAAIKIGENSKYEYLERHIHSEEGGVKVIPKAVINLGKNARYKSEFELMRGRVGRIDMDYQVFCASYSVMDMSVRVNGRGNDVIDIKESGTLMGEYSKGVLTSRVALRDDASANIYNKLVATADYARGHVDCKEIVRDNAVANAVPIVEVRNPKAHITHEASIGSVDSKELQTLMSRGHSEEEAVELIIEGLLS
jgi:Fe-S cluster assembly scaffold protein SufB